MGKFRVILVLVLWVLAEPLLGANLISSSITAYKKDSLLTVLKNTRNRKDQIKIYNQLAFNSDKVEAYIFAKKSVELARKEKDPYLLGKSLNTLGQANTDINNFDEGVENYIESANLLIETGAEKKDLAFFRLGMIFYRIGNFEKAIQVFHMSEKEYQNNNKYSNLMGIYTYMSMCYSEINKLDSALLYANYALKYKNKTHTGIRTARNIGNKGIIYKKQGKNELAITEFKKAIHAADSMNLRSMRTTFQIELSKLYLKNNEYTKVLNLLEPRIAYVEQFKLTKHQKDIHEILHETNYQIGNYEKALNHQLKFTHLKDSIAEKERIKAHNDARYSFEIENRKQQIEHLNSTNRLHINILIITAIALTGLIITFIFLLNAHGKLKVNTKTLNLQKIELEKREQEKSLLLRELNHRVKNNLQMVSGLLSLQATQLKEHPAAEALKSGMRRVDALTLLHQKLYRTESDTNIDIKDFIVDLINGLIKNIDQKVELDLKLDSYVMIMDKAIPLGLIINELVTNSIKYGILQNSASKLEFAINTTTENLNIRIADNGPGLPKHLNWKKSQTFGLKLVNSMTRQLNGTIVNNSDNGCVWELKFKRERLEKIV